MKINIVRTEGSWVIGNITDQYKKHLPNCTISPVGKTIKDGINLYITYAAYRSKSGGIDVGWFTHKENQHFTNVANQVDYCIAMSNKTSLLLPPNKTFVVEPGVDNQYIKPKIKIGCVGRHYPSNRKNYHLIENISKIPNIEMHFTNGKLKYEELPAFYNFIDYLLVLSNNEGGPMPVKEAIAMGKPVIAPDVGWCWEYPVIKYSSLEELNTLLNKLSTPYTWEQSSRDLYNKLKELYYVFEQKNK